MYNTDKLTLELRDIVENGTDIWNFDYPSYYTGEEKKEFEKKVIDHYYFRQIGQETVGRFLHYFRSRIREIMPYYIRMYESVKLMDDLENPFDNVDVVETFEEETTGQASGTSNGTQSGSQTTKQSGTESTSHNDTKTTTDNKEHRFSNTPQGSISNLDSYMTEASKDSDSSSETVNGSASGTSSSDTSVNSSGESSGTSSSESSGSTKHTLTRKGNQGVNTYAHDIMEYRQSLIDVDMMIINNLQDLFLGVY